MNIGYIKGIHILNDKEAEQKKLKQLNVSKLYIDRQGESIKLRELLKYVRLGDNIVVENIQHLSKSLGEFTELALSLRSQGVNIICKQQQINTSTYIWDKLLEQLGVFISEPIETSKGRAPRNIEDLDSCFDLVEQGQLTVEDACKKLNIGKSTYYRRWRQVKSKPEVERHPEQFDYYESLVVAGQITVTEAAKQMNIGITTYYRMRKAHIEKISEKCI